MELDDFLKRMNDTPDFPGVAVIAFESAAYPSYFFSQLLTILKAKTACVSLDSETHKLADIKAQLETSFLGNRMVYWVKNTHALDAATKKSWLSYTKTYHGPHCMLYFRQDAGTNKAENERMLAVELPEFIDANLYCLLYGHFYPAAQIDTAFVAKLFGHSQKISLDQACMLMGYQTVVGRKSDSFFSQWLSKLVVPEKSLFTLSQYLFAQQPKLFLQQWKALKNDFPDEFWVAYWSEQIWQATLFVSRARSQGFDAAKKGAFRLPFSFINKDWRKYSPESLTQEHQYLTKLDYNLKNSAGTHGLELWYHKFLTVA